MTYEEAKYIVVQLRDEYTAYNDERSIIAEALVIAKEALKKQIPKKPIEVCEFAENDLVGICPICNEGVNNELKYCMECGQKLEW